METIHADALHVLGVIQITNLCIFRCWFLFAGTFYQQGAQVLGIPILLATIQECMLGLQWGTVSRIGQNMKTTFKTLTSIRIEVSRVSQIPTRSGIVFEYPLEGPYLKSKLSTVITGEHCQLLCFENKYTN